MSRTVVIIGGGPAGLMAAEAILQAGLPAMLYEAAPSVGRKILIAGKGGLNLTHSEAWPAFIARYREAAPRVSEWLRDFDAVALRRWAAGLGIETVVGSSGRVFPADFKAAPLLRGWVRRLRQRGLALHTGHRFIGWDAEGGLCIQAPASGTLRLHPAATILALGGASWSRLGADGRWVEMLRAAAIDVAPLRPSNCGFECDWSPHFATRHAGAPVKPVAAALSAAGERGQGEFVITTEGIEGSLIYALSAPLRQAIERAGEATLWLDLLPGHTLAATRRALQQDRRGRSWSEFLRRQLRLSGVRAGLLRELAPASAWQQPTELAGLIHALPLPLRRPRPLDEAISCAGGVRLAELDPSGMLQHRPGVWCAGEMVDWEAPTGGYLLNACLAAGLAAGRAAAAWVRRA